MIKGLKGADVVFLAILCLIWSLYRADHQSLTLDESNTLLFWVLPDHASHWSSHSNNHVLNSALMRASVWLFGPSHLSFRAPASFGAFLYLFASAYICAKLFATRAIRLLAASSIMLNPFFMDYFVVARGYSLSLCFTTLALAWTSKALLTRSISTTHISTVSGLLAASVTANFASLYLNLLIWLFLLFSLPRCRLRQFQYWLAAILPGLLVIFLIASEAVLEFRRSELIWGVSSIQGMAREFFDSSFQHLNPMLVNSIVATVFNPLSRLVPALLLILTALAVVAIVIDLRRKHFRFDIRLRVTLLFLGLPIAALWIHILQFILFKIPLPFERTSIFFLPPFTLGLFLLCTGRRNVSGRIAQNGVIAIGTFVVIYFVGCLRDSYFREWSICAEIRNSFPTITREYQRLKCDAVFSNLNYSSTIKVYDILDGKSTGLQVDEGVTPTKKYRLYVLPLEQHRDLIATEGLRVVFTSALSDYAVLVRD
jgi:hypothetical protein